ncbi:MAG: GIY-YIG nuclease family protein [Planctomycetota bacterium]
MGSLLAPAGSPKFAGFGPSILAQQTRGRIRRHVLPDERMAGRSMLHDHCPLCPGVYGWLDGRQQICYVGKSKSLRKRLLSYFAKTPADGKAERIRQTAQTLVWEPISNELLALIREQELIYRWRPEFNTQGQPVKRQPAFICFSGAPAPHAFFTRRITEKANHVFGPIAGTGRLRAAIESINQVFCLRDCPDKTGFEFNEQPQLFENPATAKCIRFELGSCPAPCARKCSRSNYQANVDRAIRFVEGVDTTMLLSLTGEMKQAAEACRFERAVVLRDHLANLTWLDRRMKALRRAKTLFNGVLPIEARKNRTVWLVLKGGRLVGSALEPENPKRAAAAANFLQQRMLEPDQLPVNIMEMNLQMILISWFRKNQELVKTLIPFDAAIERCGRLAIELA